MRYGSASRRFPPHRLSHFCNGRPPADGERTPFSVNRGLPDGTKACSGGAQPAVRFMKQLIETMEGLEAERIGFCSLTEALDTTTSGGKLVLHIFGALAGFERSIIRGRTRAGLDAAEARGRTDGRPKKPTEADLKAARAMLADDEPTRRGGSSRFVQNRQQILAARSLCDLPVTCDPARTPSVPQKPRRFAGDIFVGSKGKSRCIVHRTLLTSPREDGVRTPDRNCRDPETG